MTTKRPHRWFRSTRFRVTGPATLITAVIVAIGCFLLVYSLHERLTSQVDQSLANEASFVKREIADHTAISSVAMKGAYGQMFTSSGQLLGSSTNLAHQPPLVTVSDVGESGRYFTVQNSQFGEIRVLEVQLGGKNSRVLVLGESISEISAATNSLSLRLALIAPIVVLAVGGLIWLVVGFAMRPVENVRLTAAEISVANLSERIENPRTGDELEDLTVTLNTLLDRLEDAITRERRLIADAGHEFRSPLASLRATVESEIAQSSNASESQRAILRGIQRLQDLADQLLTLDQSLRPAQEDASPVDLDEIVLSEIEGSRHLPGITIDASSLSGGQVRGRELDFSRIVDNLTSNAMRHARSTVAFRLTDDDVHVALSVADDGPGVPPENVQSVFKPFFRLEEDRGRHNGGSGLGLAIVAELVAKYSGEIRVERDSSLGGACFTVEFPSARAK